MKGLTALFVGIFGTFAFSWIGLTVIPTWQIGHLNPESDEEGTEIYPRPQSGMFQRGAHVYAANGCVYCHSQQVRADYIADDIERKWGNRRSAPRDYIFERPVFLGKMRMGQDLSNIGARAPAPEESPAPAGAHLSPRSGGLQPARRSPSEGEPAVLTCNSARRITREFAGNSSRSVACAGSSRSGRALATPAVFARNFTCGQQPCRTERADSERAMADPDSRSAADVFARVASCASLCATQHQSRFEHAVIPFPLPKATYRWRAFGRCVATLRFGRAARGVGGCSEFRCKMPCRLFDGA